MSESRKREVTVRRYATAAEADRHDLEYWRQLSDADRVVHYRNTKGEPFQMVLAQLVAHVVNHGTHHRAETGMLLERLGRSPGDMDFVYYLLATTR